MISIDSVKRSNEAYIDEKGNPFDRFKRNKPVSMPVLFQTKEPDESGDFFYAQDIKHVFKNLYNKIISEKFIKFIHSRQEDFTRIEIARSLVFSISEMGNSIPRQKLLEIFKYISAYAKVYDKISSNDLIELNIRRLMDRNQSELIIDLSMKIENSYMNCYRVKDKYVYDLGLKVNSIDQRKTGSDIPIGINVITEGFLHEFAHGLLSFDDFYKNLFNDMKSRNIFDPSKILDHNFISQFELHTLDFKYLLSSMFKFLNMINEEKYNNLVNGFLQNYVRNKSFAEYGDPYVWEEELIASLKSNKKIISRGLIHRWLSLGKLKEHVGSYSKPFDIVKRKNGMISIDFPKVYKVGETYNLFELDMLEYPTASKILDVAKESDLPFDSLDSLFESGVPFLVMIANPTEKDASERSFIYRDLNGDISSVSLEEASLMLL